MELCTGRAYNLFQNRLLGGQVQGGKKTFDRGASGSVLKVPYIYRTRAPRKRTVGTVSLP